MSWKIDQNYLCMFAWSKIKFWGLVCEFPQSQQQFRWEKFNFPQSRESLWCVQSLSDISLSLPDIPHTGDLWIILLLLLQLTETNYCSQSSQWFLKFKSSFCYKKWKQSWQWYVIIATESPANFGGNKSLCVIKRGIAFEHILLEVSSI